MHILSAKFTRLLLLPILAGLIALASCGKPEPTVDAQIEPVVAQYQEALYQQQWGIAARYIHADALATFHKMLIHIAETTPNPKESKAFLQQLGAKDLRTLQHTDPKTAFVRMFRLASTYWSAETHQIWRSSHSKVIGMVPEGELYHVVLRTTGEAGGQKMSVVSVVSVKRQQEEWKIFNTAEFEKMTRNLSL